ncbi:hypothetical protein [Acetivibrio clariflavus]|uniref:Transglycosylase associated protein n=1 Tax=Acetivibrio clariflavus (strain DSM 19732 / NBRC 101661 / EBR45) TaxID=720554 RepID=G8LXT5_ACECE|nr:hypothetical protein [Acetivibrio clariflavus]AEV68838.1 Transglycosylase associated protein [Acetivibrio clariflavus DSM 19732]
MSGFILTVIIAIICGSVLNSLLAGKIKGGAGEAAVAGLVGAWIGAYMPLFNNFGPKIFDIAVIPSILGAVLGVLVLGFISVTVQKSS